MSESKLKKWVDVCQIWGGIAIIAGGVSFFYATFDAQADGIRSTQQELKEFIMEQRIANIEQEKANEEFRKALTNIFQKQTQQEKANEEFREVLTNIFQEQEQQEETNNKLVNFLEVWEKENAASATDEEDLQ